MLTKIVNIFLFVTLFFISGCSQDGFNSVEGSDSSSKLGTPDDNSEFHPPPDEDETPQVPPTITSPTLAFCSVLDLNGVTWPSVLDINGQAHLGLALNITGSFEGRSGWANLSNNFDGMGFSIGLLQQNLGMGSLQPLINDMVAMSNSGKAFDMSDSYFQTLKSMVSSWNSERTKTASISSAASGILDEGFFSDLDAISPYDGDFTENEPALMNLSGVQIQTVSSANQSSVNWALKTVYSDSGRTFKQPWSENLTKMAQSKAYVSLQLKYAMKLYNQAFKYFVAFKLTSLNHFLLMFDFVVQNGGFKQKVLNEYNLRLKQKPTMSGDEKALLILELRLRDVLPRWQSDVSSRKRTIIFSEGTVHGAKRNLKTEYCYQPEALVLTQP